jgi:hypothetical protein
VKEREWLVEVLNVIHQVITSPGPERLSIADLRMLEKISGSLHAFCQRKIELRTRLRKAQRNGYEAFEIDEGFGYDETNGTEDAIPQRIRPKDSRQRL